MKILNAMTAPCGADRSCEDCPNGYCPLRITKDKDMTVVSDFSYKPETADGIAIDIGTTTIAAVRYENGHAIAADSVINCQRRWGADVISRILASTSGASDELRSAVRGQVSGLIQALGGAGKRTVIAGNTAMISLYMGWDCTGLGRYPFTAYKTDTVYDGQLIIPGAVSGFIGGDITSGLYMCGFDKNEAVNMYIDIGTNSEMVIGNKHGILCTSAAAGPAFEGGRISCGTGAIPGAIWSVSLRDKGVKTIGGKEPTGLCGTGLIELIYELLQAGYIDKTGLLCDEYSEGFALTEDIVLYQRDIRELQTAKGAIRAGMELLMDEYGSDDIENIYIAGGFGKWLDIDKACGIGLLTDRCRDKYRIVGNGSLGGAVKVLEKGIDGIEHIRSVAKDFPLAEKSDFSELFLKYMEF